MKKRKTYRIIAVLLCFIACLIGYFHQSLTKLHEFGTLPTTQEKVIIFDFDGTLCDSLQTILNLFNELAPSYGAKPITMPIE